MGTQVAAPGTIPAEMPKEDVPLFTQKLRRLMAGRSRVEVAQAVGLPPQTLRNYLSQGGVPRADVAAKLARACEVSPAYLCDDEVPLDADPNLRLGDLSQVSDYDLMAEVNKRAEQAVNDLRVRLAEIEQTSWVDVAIDVFNRPVGEKLDAYTERLVQVVETMTMVTQFLDTYKPQVFRRVHHIKTEQGTWRVVSEENRLLERLGALVEGDSPQHEARQALLMYAARVGGFSGRFSRHVTHDPEQLEQFRRETLENLQQLKDRLSNA